MENIDLLQGKMKQLRELHPDWPEDSLTIMDRIERRMMKDIDFADFTNLDMTRKVVEQMKEIVKSIVVRLGTDENIPQDERKALFREKKAYLWLVTLLSRDYKKDLGDIEKWIDRELGK